MSFDNLCKILSEKYPDRFVNWLLGEVDSPVEILKTELSIEPIRADSVTFLTLINRILHLEFQVRLESKPPLAFRMLDYWVRLYRNYQLPITQIVIFLIPPPKDTSIPTAFVAESTRHEYQVVKMWTQDPEIFLQDPALLPLAVLARTSNPQQLLTDIAQQVNTIESVEQRQEVSSYIQLLAGLRFEKTLIRQLFKENDMRESVIFQEIWQEATLKGKLQGKKEGRKEGRKEGKKVGKLRGEKSLILRQLTHRLGELPTEVRSRIETLSLRQLDNLGEALLDFGSIVDLENWLNQVDFPTVS